jgi:hypothetical protein
MRTTKEKSYLTIFGAGLLIFALPALAQQVREDAAHRLLESTTAAKAGRAAGTSSTTKDFGNCEHKAISCGQTVTGTLTTTDCTLEDGSYVDFWKFQGDAGQNVTVTLRSNDFDSYLFLLDPNPEAVAEDDDSAGGSDAQIIYTLNGAGEWNIGANSLQGNQTGSYSVTLACGNTGAPGAPAAPSNLKATAISESEASLTWTDNAVNETGFAVEVRNGGTFVEIGSVSVNSTGATIDGLAPNTNYVFRIRARNASGTSAPSNEAAATTLDGGGGAIFLTSEHFPGFRFQVRIFNQSSPTPLVGRKEASCLPETLCVSGAIPGRSEVFVRVVGPRPNGYLWPTIVRLTSSRVEVQIQQVSTGLVKTYVLDAASPDADELNGLQDRTGFQP